MKCLCLWKLFFFFFTKCSAYIDKDPPSPNNNMVFFPLSISNLYLYLNDHDMFISQQRFMHDKTKYLATIKIPLWFK